MKKVLVRCKWEGVTYSGALTTAVILAYYHASHKNHPVALIDSFKVALTMSTNLRTRLSTPVPEDVVGSFASLVPLKSVKNPGTVLASAKFCKQDTKKGLKSPAVTDIFHGPEFFSSASVPTAFAKYVVKNSSSGDVSISNIGHYPYPMTHSLGGAGEISVEAPFLYEIRPVLLHGRSHVSTVKSFNYAMLHKYEDSDAEAAMADFLAQVESLLK